MKNNCYLDASGLHGLIAAPSDQGHGDWTNMNTTCNDLTLNGFNDWRLPTYSELQHLYDNRIVIGQFTTSHYWSSSVDNTGAQCINFYNGSFTFDSKYNANYTRAVRTF